LPSPRTARSRLSSRARASSIRRNVRASSPLTRTTVPSASPTVPARTEAGVNTAAPAEPRTPASAGERGGEDQTRPKVRRVIPFFEAALLLVFALAPLFLANYLTVFAGRVLILGMLAISFDLV